MAGIYRGQLSLEYFFMAAVLLALVAVMAGFLQSMGGEALDASGRFQTAGEAYSYMAYYDSLVLLPYMRGETGAHFQCFQNKGCFYVRDSHRVRVKPYSLNIAYRGWAR